MCLYKMAVKDAPSLFLSTEADNIVRAPDLRQLAYTWETTRLDTVLDNAADDWADAADLVLWCLQTDPQRRPSSFSDVLDHAFLSASGPRHLPRDFRQMQSDT